MVEEEIHRCLCHRIDKSAPLVSSDETGESNLTLSFNVLEMFGSTFARASSSFRNRVQSNAPTRTRNPMKGSRCEFPGGAECGVDVKEGTSPHPVRRRKESNLKFRGGGMLLIDWSGFARWCSIPKYRPLNSGYTGMSLACELSVPLSIQNSISAAGQNRFPVGVLHHILKMG